ncbi:hypothetical protein FSP39_022417 [Pinctada imbricata]|uniref:SRCR domain-containing protein n=1 Tax=Pinctada imbricata TaxID=66713 RepID=A0AA88YSC4_PINIB|nr:hypothetical protein FSP39_022417 [Pinctada imbricata]
MYIFILFLSQLICCKFQVLLYSADQISDIAKTYRSETLLSAAISRLNEEATSQNERIKAFENHLVIMISKYTTMEQKIEDLQQNCQNEGKQVAILEGRMNATNALILELGDEQKLLSQAFEANAQKTTNELQRQISGLLNIKRSFDQITVFNESVSTVSRILQRVQKDVRKIAKDMTRLNTSLLNHQSMTRPLKHSVNYLVHTFLQFKDSVNTKQAILDIRLTDNVKLTNRIDKSNTILNDSMQEIESKMETNMKEVLKYYDVMVNETEKRISIELNNINNSLIKMSDLNLSVNETCTDFYRQSRLEKKYTNLTLRRLESEFGKAVNQLQTINTKNDLINDTLVLLEDSMNLKFNETMGYLSNKIKDFESFINSLMDISFMVSTLKENCTEAYRQISDDVTRQHVHLEDKILGYINESFSNSVIELRNEIEMIERREQNITSILLHVRNRQRDNTPPTIRLVNGGRSYGRLEVLIGGRWGTVCDDNFDTNDANVVCRQLGYSYGRVKAQAYYGTGSLNIVMDNVACSGRERHIQDCRYNRGHDCNHNEDVGVVCS